MSSFLKDGRFYLRGETLRVLKEKGNAFSRVLVMRCVLYQAGGFGKSRLFQECQQSIHRLLSPIIINEAQ